MQPCLPSVEFPVFAVYLHGYAPGFFSQSKGEGFVPLGMDLDAVQADQFVFSRQQFDLEMVLDTQGIGQGRQAAHPYNRHELIEF
jgi:hypothetical protein